MVWHRRLFGRPQPVTENADGARVGVGRNVLGQRVDFADQPADRFAAAPVLPRAPALRLVHAAAQPAAQLRGDALLLQRSRLSAVIFFFLWS